MAGVITPSPGTCHGRVGYFPLILNLIIFTVFCSHSFLGSFEYIKNVRMSEGGILRIKGLRVKDVGLFHAGNATSRKNRPKDA